MLDDLTLHHINTRAAFAEVERDWHRLHEAAEGGIFVHHGFLLSWAETFGRENELYVITLRLDGELVGALPMFDTKRDHAMALMGEGRASLSQWLLHPDLQDPAAALGQMLRPPLLSFFRFEPLETADADLLTKAAEHAGLVLQRKKTMAACSTNTNTKGDFDGFLARLKSKRRWQFRKTERAFSEMELRDLRSDRDGPDALEGYLRASRRSWKAKAGTGMGATETGERFLRLLFDRLGPETCRFSAGVTPEEAVFGRFILAHKGVHYGIANDFNEACASLNPGYASIIPSVREAFDVGARSFDHTRSNPMLKALSDEEWPLERILIYRRGDPAIFLYFAAQGARRFRRRATGWKKGRKGVIA